MKILIDIRSLGGEATGIGMYAYYFARSIYNFNSAKLVLATDVIKSEELKELSMMGIEVEACEEKTKKGFGLIGYYRFLQNLIHKHKPNIFWEVNNVIPVKIKNPYGKVVVTIHDLFPITQVADYNLLYRIYYRYSLSKTLPMVDGILYDSQAIGNGVEQLFTGASGIPSFVAYATICDEVAGEIRDDNYFLYIGAIEVRKGVDMLLRAYARYREQGGDKPLYLAGRIKNKEMAALYYEIHAQYEDVLYLGYLDAKAKERVLSGCSCFLFPSRAEGFGLPVIEAMQYQKPIIASDIPIFRELFGNDINYVSISDDEAAIECLASQMQKYNKPQSQDYEVILNKFKAKALVERLMEFFGNLLSGD